MKRKPSSDALWVKRQLDRPEWGMCALSDAPQIVRGLWIGSLSKRRATTRPALASAASLCGWSPHKEDIWTCSCGHEWNTFDTGGVCPACLQQWTETQCLSCSRWSAHSDWYAH